MVTSEIENKDIKICIIKFCNVETFLTTNKQTNKQTKQNKKFVPVTNAIKELSLHYILLQ